MKKTPTKALTQLQRATDKTVRLFDNVRVKLPGLAHRYLKVAAKRDGVTMGDYVLRLIAEAPNGPLKAAKTHSALAGASQ